MAEGMSFMARSIIARFIYRRRVEEGQVEEGQVEEGQVIRANVWEGHLVLLPECTMTHTVQYTPLHLSTPVLLRLQHYCMCVHWKMYV